MKEIIVNYLTDARDQCLDFLKNMKKLNLSLKEEQELLEVINKQINTLQFIIENIDNKEAIQENALVFDWLERSIAKSYLHNYSCHEILLAIKKYIYGDLKWYASIVKTFLTKNLYWKEE